MLIILGANLSINPRMTLRKGPIPRRGVVVKSFRTTAPRRGALLLLANIREKLKDKVKN